MIKMPNNWNEVKEFSERPKLPLGAYVCKVKNAVIQNNEYGEQLCLVFDIAEGDYKDFYKNEFDTNNAADKKYKGVLRVWLPKNNGDSKDETTKSILKGLVTSFEKSNVGYIFDWNEKSLVNKWVGIMFRNEEWLWNGKTGWAVRPFKAISVESVRNGDFQLPKDKPLAETTNTAQIPDYSNDFTEVAGEDLPF